MSKGKRGWNRKVGREQEGVGRYRKGYESGWRGV